MLVIIDDFLPENELRLLADVYTQAENPNAMVWHDQKLDGLENQNDFASKALRTASSYFDLTKMVGFEKWAHYNTRPDFHYDKDEKLFQETGRLVFPLCSIVFYPIIEDLVGGTFITESFQIAPKCNRLVIFNSNIGHRVDNFTGTRLSVLIAPWHYKLAEYA